MKAANILISNRGQLQIADFGLARHYDGPSPRAGQGNGEAVRDYTALVVTRWYRPPELLLQLRRYTPAIDLWGAGCVFAEMFERRPILDGKTDINQAEIIFELMGSPTEENMPGWSQLPGCEGVRQWAPQKGTVASRFRGRMGDEGLDLLRNLLTLDWRKRINAQDALKHPYFSTAPLPARPETLPRFEDSHELDKRKHQNQRAALPPAPAGGTVGMGPDEQDYYYDRGGRYDRRDRGPPGHPAPPPRGRYDDRPPLRDGPYRDRDRDDSRQPAWARSRPDARPPPYANGGRNGYTDADRPRRPPPPGGGGGGARNQDTYIPAYGDENGAPRRDDDNSHRGYRDRDTAPRDRDYPPRDRYDHDHRRTRSRSPIDRRRDDWPRDRERDRRPGPPAEGDRQRRERLQDREREMYNRK